MQCEMCKAKSIAHTVKIVRAGPGQVDFVCSHRHRWTLIVPVKAKEKATK